MSVSGPADPPTLSLVVPAYNEEAALEATVRSLEAGSGKLGVAFEIIVVDDGSRDRTGAVADRLARELPAVAVIHQANRGIGGAFRAGARRAAGSYLALWPADMPADSSDLLPYVGALGRADVIVGCRRRRIGYTPLMRFNAWLYRILVARLFGLELADMNWIHVYRSDQFRKIRLDQDGIPMLAEALVRLRDAGASFLEVSVDMKPRAGGTPSAGRPRVMMRTLAGLLAFWRAWRTERRACGDFRPPVA